MSSFLVDKHYFEEIINPTENENLYYVGSGPIPPNPSALLGNGVFEGFIEKAKIHFDYIVLDNAPVTIVSDGLLTGQLVDINLFVLRQGYSNKRQLRYLNGIKEDNKLKQLGVVFNDTSYNGYGYSSYGNYGYGYGYYEDDNEKGGFKNKMVKKFSRS